MTRILVVDDDVSHAELMRVVLEDAKFDVVTAYGARDLPAGPFACVLTDLVTVGAYTFEDTRDWVLSLRDRYPSTPVIVTTAHRDAREDGERLGAKVIVKPFDVDFLTSVVHEVLRDGASGVTS